MSSLHYRIERHLTEILQVLTYEWDPLRIKDKPDAEKQYKDYTMMLCGLLDLRKPLSTITGYLWMVETQIMGLKGNFAHTEEIAKRLCAMAESNAVSTT